MQTIQSPQRQRGATMLGMLFMTAIIGLALYSVIRLWPLYFEYYSVARSMEAVAKEGGNSDVPQLRNALQRRWAIEDIKTLDVRDIEIKKTNTGMQLHASYEGRVSFVANIYWVIEFDKTVNTSGNM